jgi:hypothetical protein
MSDFESQTNDAIDAWYEKEAQEKLEEHYYDYWYSDIIEDYKDEALSSFFEVNENILLTSYTAQIEAKKLIVISPSATILFTFTAIETAIKHILLKPMIYGMTHNENVAELIVEKFLKQSNVNSYIDLAFNLVKKATELELKDAKTTNGKSIKKEIVALSKKRNDIIHSGKLYNKSDAEDALMILEELYNKIIIKMLEHIGFTISNKKICRIS